MGNECTKSKCGGCTGHREEVVFHLGLEGLCKHGEENGPREGNVCYLRTSELCTVAVIDPMMSLLCFKAFTSYPQALSVRFEFLIP